MFALPAASPPRSCCALPRPWSLGLAQRAGRRARLHLRRRRSTQQPSSAADACSSAPSTTSTPAGGAATTYDVTATRVYKGDVERATQVNVAPATATRCGLGDLQAGTDLPLLRRAAPRRPRRRQLRRHRAGQRRPGRRRSRACSAPARAVSRRPPPDGRAHPGRGRRRRRARPARRARGGAGARRPARPGRRTPPGLGRRRRTDASAQRYIPPDSPGLAVGSVVHGPGCRPAARGPCGLRCRMPGGQRAAHLLELGAGRHLLGVDRGLDAVEEALEPADELGLGDPQLGLGRGALLGERQREPLELLDQLGGQAGLELLDRGLVDLLEAVAAGLVERAPPSPPRGAGGSCCRSASPWPAARPGR